MDIRTIPIQELLLRCENQIDKGTTPVGDGSCYELFRRAIDQNDPLAWEGVVNLYTDLIRYWVGQSHIADGPNQDDEDLMQHALLKFWKSFQDQDRPIETKFRHEGAVLKYLKRCVATTAVDLSRKEKIQSRVVEKLGTQIEILSYLDTDFEVGSYLEMDHVEMLRAWLKVNIKSESEALVIQLIIIEGIKASELIKTHPEEFSSVQKIYSIKNNFLKRARRFFKEMA